MLVRTMMSSRIHDDAMKRITPNALPLIALVLLLATSSHLSAQPNEFLNVGLRFGWMLGDRGGPVVGFEASYTWLDSRTFTHGPVFGTDYNVNRREARIHAGYELIAPVLPIGGIEVGPTLRVGEERSAIGLHTTVFAGLYGYPYYSATVYPGEITHEVGAYLKLPIQTDDRPVVNF
jgi:hypothetical protein